jgi:asparagine synthase (glutamine-hydrolysing)
MCGIAGIVSIDPREISMQRLKVMTDVLKHRGPDGEGWWISENNMVGLGHRRLSIIDLSDNGKQPMHYANGRYTISYNGEIYNYLELKSLLVKKGYSFQSNTDTEVILAMYDFKREQCLNDLDGMFAFAIWDSKEKTLFCARDRFGEKPFFYYYEPGKYFVFASEMKALFAIDIPKSINYSMLFNYLTNGYVEDRFNKSNTFYYKIKKLEPAHYIILKSNFIIVHNRYWDLNIKHRVSISFDKACEQLRELLSHSVCTRLRSDVSVGSSLSGGLDSSTIVCLLRAINPSLRQKTFSASFPGYEKDESSYIKIVINKTNVEAYFTYPQAETLADELDNFFYHQEEPVATTSQFAQWEVMKLAKTHGTVVLLDGQGADEILAGYTYYYRTFFQELYATDDKLFKEEYKAYRNWGGNHFKLDWRFKVQARYPKLYNNYLQWRSGPLQHEDIHPEFYNQFKSCTYKPLMFEPLLNSHLNKTLRINGMFEALLRYGDRNSMAFSREVRLPYLYHKLVEFVFGLPSIYKIHHGWTKYILRKSYEELIPKEITWRKLKIGYEPPHHEWLQTQRMQEIISVAVSFLHKEKIINIKRLKPNKMWEYLMAHKLIANA